MVGRWLEMVGGEGRGRGRGKERKGNDREEEVDGLASSYSACGSGGCVPLRGIDWTEETFCLLRQGLDLASGWLLYWRPLMVGCFWVDVVQRCHCRCLLNSS